MKKRNVSKRIKRLKSQWQFLVLCLPALLLTFIFKYMPMYGILIAFKKYRPNRGVWGSEWLDPVLQNFTRFFSTPNCWDIIGNTFKIGIVSLIFMYPAPILFALLLNEMRNRHYKKIVQTISYIPHFVSTVVLVGMLTGFASVDGMFNQIRELFGLAAVNMNEGDRYFLLLYVGSAVWQGMGWGSIIYLSALTNVDTSLFDVADVDGANRWQKMLHIELPAILPTTMVILILNTGTVLTQDYTKILLMQNDTNRSLIEVVSTFVYRMGIEQGQFGYTTAVNLLIAVVSFFLVFVTNVIVRKISPENSLW